MTSSMLRGADEVAASSSVMLMHCQRELEYERHMKRPVEGDLSVAQAVLYRGSSWAFFAMSPSATSTALSRCAPSVRAAISVLGRVLVTARCLATKLRTKRDADVRSRKRRCAGHFR